MQQKLKERMSFSWKTCLVLSCNLVWIHHRYCLVFSSKVKSFFNSFFTTSIPIKSTSSLFYQHTLMDTTASLLIHTYIHTSFPVSSWISSTIQFPIILYCSSSSCQPASWKLPCDKVGRVIFFSFHWKCLF